MYIRLKTISLIKSIFICCLFIANICHSALLVNDKVIYSPDNDANFWGYQIKIQNDRMLVSNYATVNGFGLAGGVDYYQKDDNGDWLFQQRIEPPIDLNLETGLLSFGKTTLDNDRLLIGATWADVGNQLGGGVFEQDAGKVFLYFYNAGTNKWDFDLEFQASDAQKVDAFAQSVFANNHILISADFKDVGEYNNAGQVYAYSQDILGDWHEVQKIESTALTSSSDFGTSIHSCNDQVLITAYNVTNDPSNDGIKRAGVYIYEKSADQFWYQKQLLLSDDDGGAGHGSFGRKLLCDENRLIISAFQEHTDGYQNGVAYFFIKDDAGNWVRQQKLAGIKIFENSRRVASSRFGAAIAWIDDTLLVSERVGYDDSAEGVIHQYQYDTENKQWNIVQSLTSIEPSLYGAHLIDDIAMDVNNILVAVINDRTYDKRVDTIHTLKWVADNNVDLELTAVFDKIDLIIGDEFIVTYTVNNLGEDLASKIFVKDMMYGQVILKSSPSYCNITDNILICELQDILPNDQFSFSVTYQTDPTYENSIRTKAVVETGMGEANGLNNASFQTVTISPKPATPAPPQSSGGGSTNLFLQIGIIIFLAFRKYGVYKLILTLSLGWSIFEWRLGSKNVRKNIAKVIIVDGKTLKDNEMIRLFTNQPTNQPTNL